ncbi:DinB family protein [Pedobacter nutrimenti]|uniref:Uncharacterized protein DUF1572 n=1 Tax=Pedobacter nutrimenti TaxID=1241337 RepID=A0A318UAX5_9SPHI|nr:DinB family protein [Pedobacter nutrimenti]PYF72590.1 uncharacterized protein DUF1572 [Pedobacter nutrimenti]
MMTESLKSIFERDLKQLKLEIGLYQQESNLWLTKKGISNAAGNLCLHLIGNLSHFIGAQLGHIGYVRNRPLEFSDKDVPRAALLESIDQVIAMIGKTLDGLDDAELEKNYPLVVFEKEMTTGYFLIHLSTHLSYHLGQINYHRRLIDVEG